MSDTFGKNGWKIARIKTKNSDRERGALAKVKNMYLHYREQVENQNSSVDFSKHKIGIFLQGLVGEEVQVRKQLNKDGTHMRWYINIKRKKFPLNEIEFKMGVNYHRWRSYENDNNQLMFSKLTKYLTGNNKYYE